MFYLEKNDGMGNGLYVNGFLLDPVNSSVQQSGHQHLENLRLQLAKR